MIQPKTIKEYADAYKRGDVPFFIAESSIRSLGGNINDYLKSIPPQTSVIPPQAIQPRIIAPQPTANQTQFDLSSVPYFARGETPEYLRAHGYDIDRPASIIPPPQPAKPVSILSSNAGKITAAKDEKKLSAMESLLNIEKQAKQIQGEITTMSKAEKAGMKITPQTTTVQAQQFINLSGSPAGAALTNQLNQVVSEGLTNSDTDAYLTQKQNDILSVISQARGTDSATEKNSLVNMAIKQIKEYQTDLNNYLKDIQVKRAEAAKLAIPGEKEKLLTTKINNLKTEIETIKLKNEERKFNEYEAQTAPFAARRGQEFDIRTGFEVQQKSLELQNVLGELGIEQGIREMQYKSAEQALDDFKNDYELQNKVNDKITEIENKVIDKAAKLTDDSREFLGKLLDDLKETKINPAEMSPQTIKKLKELSEISNTPYEYTLDVLKANYTRQVFDDARKLETERRLGEKPKTTDIQEYELARKQGFKGTFVDYQRTMANLKIGDDGIDDKFKISIQNQSLFDAFNSAKLGLPKAQMEQATKTFQSLIKRNDINGAKNYLLRTAMAGAGVDQQNQAIGRKQALDTMAVLKNLLGKLPTNLLTGKIENIAQKAGLSSNSDLAYIGSQIQQQIQVYRRAMTGVAFNPSESVEYGKIFPDITNIGSLNAAKIDSLIDSFNRNNRSVLSFYIGDTNYDKIFGEYETPVLPSSRITDEELKKDYDEYLKQQKGSLEFSSIAKSTSPVLLKENPSGFFNNFLKVFGF